MQIPRAGNNMVSIIYVKFDHVDADNSLVNSLLRNELKEFVSITAITKTFLYSHKNETVAVQWKQCPLKLGDAITEHNFQSTAVKYMKGDFDCTSENVRLNTVAIS